MVVLLVLQYLIIVSLRYVFTILPEIMSYDMVKNDVINTINLCSNGDSYLKDNPPTYKNISKLEEPLK